MHAGRVPILTFHALDDRRDVCGFSAGVFRRAVERLRAAGVRTVGVAELADAVRHGRPLPDRSVALTFDDGYRSVYDEAFPVLRDAGMTATVFLTVGSGAGERLPTLASREMLAWSEIREMHRHGFVFGAHTLSHRDLTRLQAPEVEREMRTSQAIVADRLGTVVSCFAYPYGRFDATSHAIARELFASACSDALGLVGPASDPWALERVEMYYFRTDRRFAVTLGRRLPACLRVLDVPRRARRWITSWRAGR
jgi:peptidoglycan/xylan/chitin deacetylase (PgdA/CDA1 family)